MFSFTLRYVHLCLCVKLRWKICTFLYVCVYGHVWIFSVYKPSCSSVPDYCWDYFYSVYIVSHTAFASVFLNARLSLVLEIHAHAHVHNTQMLPNPKELRRSWNWVSSSVLSTAAFAQYSSALGQKKLLICLLYLILISIKFTKK